HLRCLAPRQAIERDLGEVRASCPRRTKVGPKGPQRQDVRGGTLINQQVEELQGGRIDPVQVFHDKEHRLLGGDAQEDRQEGLQRLLLLLLRRFGQRGIISGQWEREDGGKEGDSFCEWQTILHQEPLEFAQLLLRGLFSLKAQGDPLQQ